MDRLAKRAKSILRGIATNFWWSPESNRTIVHYLERWADHAPEDLYLSFEERHLTIGRMNAEVNRHVAAYRRLRVGPGSVVALRMGNRPEYLMHLYALGKLGAIAALVNPQVTGAPLAHALTAAKTTLVIAGSGELAGMEEALRDAGMSPEACLVDTEPGADPGRVPFAPWSERLPSGPAPNPPETASRKLSEVLAYIYTSGTTGLPKPAIVKHHRFVRAGAVLGGLAGATEDDCLYNCLPLYHANGVVIAASIALVTRSRLVLARKFSASRFWQDCRRYGATLAIYIGELCRYLYLQPPGAADRGHAVERLLGNGLRPDIWEPFCQRFGIQRVVEFYGSTEGNAETANLTNTPGSCGVLIPRKLALARWDPAREELVRDRRGFAERAGPGEPGLLLGRIEGKNEYGGYTNPAQSASKVLHDVFAKGDAWFNTGDLLRRDWLRRLYFVDRLGDTFRWKGENVSTNEVQNQLCGAPFVREANVYGVEVPGAEGRAGMATLVVDPGFSPETLYAHVARALPTYAQPRFVRLVGSLDLTGTFKLQKRQLQEQGFDPGVVPDRLLVWDPRRATYAELDEARHREVVEGRWSI
jgi:acyl-CoA synthetase (AMP-forming)/AMP-acid ligase II